MKYLTNLTHTFSIKLSFYITCVTTWNQIEQKLDEVPDKSNRRLQQLRRGRKAQNGVAMMVLGWEKRSSPAFGNGGWATEPAMASRKCKWGRQKRERFHPGVRLLGNQTNALMENLGEEKEFNAIRGGELAAKFVKLVDWMKASFGWLGCSCSCDDNRLRRQSYEDSLSSRFLFSFETEIPWVSRFGHSDAMNEWMNFSVVILLRPSKPYKIPLSTWVRATYYFTLWPRALAMKWNGEGSWNSFQFQVLFGISSMWLLLHDNLYYVKSCHIL